MPRADKVEKVKEMKRRLEAADAAVFADYRGLTVRDIDEVRGSLVEAGAQFSVVKNSLARLAVRDADLEDLEPLIDGPTAIAFVQGDPVLGTKALVEATKKFPVLEVRGGLAEGRLLTAEQIKELASLRGREEMLSQMAGILGAHLSKAAYLLGALQMRFLSLLEAYKEKLPPEAAADAGEPPAGETAEEPPAGETAEEPPVGETAEEPPPEEPATTEPPSPDEAADSDGEANDDEKHDEEKDEEGA